MTKTGITRTYRFTSISTQLLIVTLLIIGGLRPQHSVNAGVVVAGFSEYYIPAPSDQLIPILDNIESSYNWSGGTTLTNVITISVAADSTTVYFDHWENGYGVDATAYDEKYVANKGAVLTYKSTNIPYPRGSSLTACSGSSFPAVGGKIVSATGGNATYCYDGMDRIYVAGGAVSVAQSFWPTPANTNFANAWEIYPIKPYQTSYKIPVGQEMCTATTQAQALACGSLSDFINVYVLVQSTSDGTSVQIDDPTTAGIEVSTTLAQGKTTELWHIHGGTTVTASNPVQVQFIDGEDLVNSGQSNSKSYTAVPNSMWSSSYYSPVSGDDGNNSRTDVFIYNPTSSALTINYQDSTGSGSFSVAANSTESFSNAANANRTIPFNSALYLEASDHTTKFWAIGAVDAGGTTFNWGFTLIPPDLLTNEYFISWAPGNSNVPPTAVGNPVWVTPINNNTTIFVDYSPTDGIVNATYTKNRIEMQKIMDPDFDNTGMHIWATGPIALSWGEDPDTAAVANPGLDAGYTILPLNSSWMDVVVQINKTANPTSILPAIDQVVTFDLVVDSNFPLGTVQVVDDLPSNWQYISNSATIKYPNNSIVNVAPSITGVPATGQTLTWSDVIPSGLNIGDKITISFQAKTVLSAPSIGTLTNRSTVNATAGGQTFSGTGSVDVTVLPPLDLNIVKTNNVNGSIGLDQNAAPSGTFIWTVQVNNAGTTTAATFTAGQTLLTDHLPNAGATYAIPATATNAGGTTGTINCSITTFNLSCVAGAGGVQIPANGSFSVPVTVKPTASGYFTNPRAGGVCSVDPNNNVVEGNENNNSCSDPITVLPYPDLTVTKSNNTGANGYTNSPFNWTLQVNNTSNTGPATFADGQTILTDSLPSTNITYNPSVTVTNSSGTTGTVVCTIVSNILTCTASGSVVIPGGQSFSAVTIATPSATGTFTNPVGGACSVDPNNNVYEGTGGSAAETNNTCANNSVIVVNGTPANLTASKTNDDADSSVSAGTPFNWSVQVSNGAGTATASFASGSVLLKDNLPSGAAYGSPTVTKSAGTTGTISCVIDGLKTLTCSASGGAVAIPAGQSFSVAFSVTPSSSPSISNPAAGGVCRADPNGEVAEGNELDNSCSNTVSVVAPSLGLAKSDGVVSVNPGGTASYTMTISNTGTGPTAGTITLVDVLPTGLTIPNGAVALSGANAANWSCTAASNVLTCTSSTPIALSQSSVFTFTANVSLSASGNLINHAQVGGGGDLATNTPTSISVNNCSGSNSPTKGCAVDSNTVGNNTLPVATIAVSPASVLEDGASNLIYTVTLDKAPLVDTTVNLTTTGTAAGSDYTGSVVSVTITAGTTTATVTINPATDSTVEPNETVIITIGSGTGYTVGNPSSATGTITDDDIPVATIAVSPASVLEDGASNLIYTVTLDKAPLVDTTINLTTTGTAAGSDYTGSVVSVTITAGTTTATVTINPATDSTVEPNETVIITIGSGTGYTVGNPSSATGTISDDDIPVATIAVSPASVLEDGASNLIYTVTLDKAPLVDTTVNLTTTGTAAGSDYTGSVVSVTITAGTTTATVTINPATDSTVEPNETVIITIGSGTGYTVENPSSATGTITNDDIPVATIAVSPASVLEDGASNLIYTVTLDKAPLVDTTINLTTTGTAAGSDYTGSVVSVTITAGTTTATVTINPATDSTVEPNETVIITIGSGTGYTVGNPSSATGTISDDEASVDLSLAKVVNNASPKLGDAVIFTITVTNHSLTAAATTIVIHDALPNGLTLNSSTPSIGAYSNVTGNWTIATLSANTSATLQLNVTVTQIGAIANTAEITAADQTDPDSTVNNQSPAEDDQASVSLGSVFDPPSGIKVFNDAGLPELEFRLVWINSGNTSSINTQVTDNIPAGTTYIPGSIVCAPQGSSSNAVAATAPLNTAVANSYCAFDSVNNRIQWQGSIGPDNGNLTEAAAANEVVITFRVDVSSLTNEVSNTSASRTDTDGDSNFTDENVVGDSLINSNAVVWARDLAMPDELPKTGFAPNVITSLPEQPSSRLYAATAIWIEIPSLGVHIPIVGIPLIDKEWDVSWLWKQAGWLNGTAFPGWSGNSVLTSHVTLPNGKAGPFAQLGKLKWGDRIIIHSYGSVYTYEVRENRTISPNNTSVLKHEDEAWLTLITCKTFNEKTETYSNRVAVRAVLIKVLEEK